MVSTVQWKRRVGVEYPVGYVTRNIVLKESTKDDLKRLHVSEAPMPPTSELPSLPGSFSIRDEMSEVEDQGTQGSCTAFCVTACLENLHVVDLSEGQVNHEAEATYGDCTAGLAVVHAFKICHERGAVEGNLWPYDDQQTCWGSPPDISGAARYKFSGFGYVYQRPRSAALSQASGAGAAPGLPISLQIQRHLFSRRRPIAVSVPVVWSSWPWSGRITMPAPNGLAEFAAMSAPSNTDGWHCVAICGWDNSTGRFTFQNSWGKGWGDKGYGTIPYQYIEAYSDIGIIGW